MLSVSSWGQQQRSGRVGEDGAIMAAAIVAVGVSLLVGALLERRSGAVTRELVNGDGEFELLVLSASGKFSGVRWL